MRNTVNTFVRRNDDDAPIAPGTPEVITVGWQNKRKAFVPAPARRAPPLQDRLAWPAETPPATVLKPGSGQHAQNQQGRPQVVAIALFGITEARLKFALKQIARQQRTKGRFQPLILTDSTLHAALRRAGAIFEYFPASVYLADPDGVALSQRFATIWQKWKPSYLIDLGKPGLLSSRLDDYESYFQSSETAKGVFEPWFKPDPLPPAPPPDIAALKAEYLTKGLDAEADTFALYRILGNDLPPRHDEGQTLTNLRFILENEPKFPNCEKRWVINRITDPEQERAIIAILDEFGQSYITIPFDLHEYKQVEWDLDGFPQRSFFLNGRYGDMQDYDKLRAEAHSRRHKNKYVMNNNGARNAALRDGLARAKWVMPWDGNCFLTNGAWTEITQAITAAPYLKYFSVPMARTTENTDLLLRNFRPDPIEEPQLIFRKDAEQEFNEDYHYGRRPKVELFWRLGVAGPWDNWRDDVWDLKRPSRSTDAGSHGSAGWVARLHSGRDALEQNSKVAQVSRGVARIEGILSVTDDLDRKALALSLDPAALTAYDGDLLASLKMAPPDTARGRLYARLQQEAELALQRGPYSVMDKTTVPPSGDKHDYMHPPPYWWPDPNTPTGLPGSRRDGERAPGTRLYEPDSEKYDRTRLQRLFDDTTILALAAESGGTIEHARHAANLLRHWFLDERTRMNPNLHFAQVIPGAGEAKGHGVIEMKDLYFYLDAVRILEKHDVLTAADNDAFRQWLNEYLVWLHESPQGRNERATGNNHGTCYDLQVGAIAAFLGDVDVLAATLRRSRERILGQFAKDGSQPHELKRTQTQHYCFFNLQNWINLANLADSCGDALWDFTDNKGLGLAKAFKWLIDTSGKSEWPFEQNGRFDEDRFIPLIYAAQARFAPEASVGYALGFSRKPLFFPHDGVPPFWMLSRSVNAKGHSSNPGLTRAIERAEIAARDMVQGSGFRLSVKNLEQRLWGGYCEFARADLEMLKMSPKASGSVRAGAAWALAQWHAAHQDHDKALVNIREAEQLSGPSAETYLLPKVDCLVALGNVSEARMLLDHSARRSADDPNQFFRMANTCLSVESGGSAATEQEKLSWINKVFLTKGMAGIDNRTPDMALDFSNIRGGTARTVTADEMAGAQVSVVMPVRNASATIRHAIESLQEQTWQDLQIIVVDNCSTDATLQIVEDIAKADPRVQLVAMSKDSSTGACLNAGMARASGQFVTTHDADGWAHPQKIEAQMKRLRQDQRALGVVSRSITMRGDLHAQADWRPDGSLISGNHASFLFSRHLLDETGPWDTVQAGAREEFIARFKAKFGDTAVVETDRELPLTLCRARNASAAEPGDAARTAVLHGPLADYARSYQRWHAGVEPDELALPDTAPTRPFPAPLALVPGQNLAEIDTVFIADFTSNGFRVDAIAEVVAQAAASCRSVGIFHWPDYENTSSADFHTLICELLVASSVVQISAGQQIKAHNVTLCDPYLAGYPIDGMPDFGAASIDVMWTYSGSQDMTADKRRRIMPTKAELERLFGIPCHLIDVAP